MEFELESKSNKLRITKITDVRKNKVKYTIKKDSHRVPKKVLDKIEKSMYVFVSKSTLQVKCTKLI